MNIGTYLSKFSSNCEDHQTHTQHSSELYKDFAKSIQNAVILRYPFIKVYLKPIDTDIFKNEEQTDNKNVIIDELYKEVRIGAMEVLLCKKINGTKEIFQLFSKLQSHQWPSITKLLDSIVQYVPKFNLNINIFDKESGILDYNKDYEEGKEEDYTYSKYEHIKINVYYLNNDKVREIIKNASEGILAIKYRNRKLS